MIPKSGAKCSPGLKIGLLFRRGNLPEITQIPKILKMGTGGGPDPPKMTKNMVWSLRNLEKQHPKPIENLENPTPKKT